jgi:acyl-CoA thioester hydrolase
VNNLEYLRWMVEAAQAHSDACGWTVARYLANRFSWVVRSHHIDYLRPAFAGEVLTLVTWVGDMEAQGSPRHYLLWRGSDRKVLAQATTQWVFVDGDTGRPRPVPAEVRDAFPLVSEGRRVLEALRSGELVSQD